MLVIHQYHLKEMKTHEIKTVKLRSVVQLCNLEAVGFQWMVSKNVCQVVESVLSFSELTHALKSPISDRFGASTTMSQCNESVTIVVGTAQFLHHPLQGGCVTYSAGKNAASSVCFWLAATDCLCNFAHVRRQHQLA